MRPFIVLLVFSSAALLTNVTEAEDAKSVTAEQISQVAEANESEDSHRAGLHWFDWLLICLYGCGTIALGWYFSRRQRSTTEYFVGSGKMNSTLIGVSLFATLLSTISYLSMPGEALGKGPVNMATMLAVPVVYLIVAFGLLPVYMKQRVTSAYELLEAKLGLSVRLLGALMFVALRLVWMSLLIYLAAKAMLVVLDAEFAWEFEIGSWTFSISGLQIVVLATGFVAVIYTSLGRPCGRL